MEGAGVLADDVATAPSGASSSTPCKAPITASTFPKGSVESMVSCTADLSMASSPEQHHRSQRGPRATVDFTGVAVHDKTSSGPS